MVKQFKNNRGSGKLSCCYLTRSRIINKKDRYFGLIAASIFDSCWAEYDSLGQTHNLYGGPLKLPAIAHDFPIAIEI